MKTAAARRALVQRLEEEASRSPRLYRFKLALLALLGYAVLWGALALTLGTVAFLVLYMAFTGVPSDPQIVIPIMVLGIMGTVILRALWIRFAAPEGHYLGPAEAPGLQAEVERVRAAVGAPRLHAIVITGELNAAAAFVPAGLGLFNQRHCMMLGLPLLQALDRREFAAVVAHEFGHFHGGHGHFSGWIYRLRSSWQRMVLATSVQGVWGSQLFWLFFRWYSPYFDAYSQVLARQQEYAADAVAAQVAGRESAASALLRMEQVSDWLQGEFWPEVEQSATMQSYPPVRIQERLAEALQALPRGTPLPAWTLRRQTAVFDTHPSLRKRLAALQVELPLASAGAPITAAQELLDPALIASLQQRFSREWRDAAEADWQERHRQFELDRVRLAELEGHPSHTPQEALELACHARLHRPGVDALALHRAALEQMPSSGNAHYRLGALLLERDEAATALAHLQRAMELDPLLVPPSLFELERYCRRHADAPEAIAAADALHARYSTAAEHDSDIDGPAAAGLQPHGLDDTQLRELAKSFGGFEKASAAWVVRKALQGDALQPHFLVLLEWQGSVASERAAIDALHARLRLPGTCMLLPSSGDASRIRLIKQVAGEPAWRRRR